MSFLKVEWKNTEIQMERYRKIISFSILNDIFQTLTICTGETEIGNPSISLQVANSLLCHLDI
jgi:hypothetical protein